MQVWSAHITVKQLQFAAVALQREAEARLANDKCGEAIACLRVRITALLWFQQWERCLSRRSPQRPCPTPFYVMLCPLAHEAQLGSQVCYLDLKQSDRNLLLNWTARLNIVSFAVFAH